MATKFARVGNYGLYADISTGALYAIDEFGSLVEINLDQALVSVDQND